jgi:hypothetical protein
MQQGGMLDWQNGKSMPARQLRPLHRRPFFTALSQGLVQKTPSSDFIVDDPRFFVDLVDRVDGERLCLGDSALTKADSFSAPF